MLQVDMWHTAVYHLLQKSKRYNFLAHPVYAYIHTYMYAYTAGD